MISLKISGRRSRRGAMALAAGAVLGVLVSVIGGFDGSVLAQGSDGKDPPLCRSTAEEESLRQQYHKVGGTWRSSNVRTEKWKEACARRYVKHNFRVFWMVGTGIAGALTAISLAWAGFVYMQESASGGDVSQVRNLIVRSLAGFVFAGMAWVVWQGILVTLFGTSEFTYSSFLGFG